MLRRFVIGLLLVGTAVVALYACMLVPYMAASSQYERLVARHPKTRAEVERELFWFVTHRRIDRSESDIGRHFNYAGQFEQYSALGGEIDVVYDGDRVVMVLPSFE